MDEKFCVNGCCQCIALWWFSYFVANPAAGALKTWREWFPDRIITGIFGFSAIFIRFFTDAGQEAFGKEKVFVHRAFDFDSLYDCLCIFYSVNEMITIRILHGFGFGADNDFLRAIAAEIILKARMGEGIGYFGPIRRWLWHWHRRWGWH